MISPFRQMRMRILRIQIGCRKWEVHQATNMSLLEIVVVRHLLKYGPMYLN
jgi:hypothetical protein